MLGFINIILTMLGKINDSDHDKYHMYDSIPSYILIFFRLIGVVTFIIGIGITVYSNRKDKGIMEFYKRFTLLGGLYFVSLPLLFIFSQFFHDNDKEEFAFIFVELIKNGTNFALTYMITSKKSQYREIKISNRSFMEKDGNKLI